MSLKFGWFHSAAFRFEARVNQTQKITQFLAPNSPSNPTGLTPLELLTDTNYITPSCSEEPSWSPDAFGCWGTRVKDTNKTSSWRKCTGKGTEQTPQQTQMNSRIEWGVFSWGSGVWKRGGQESLEKGSIWGPDLGSITINLHIVSGT